jgi:hypothetical protein
MKKTALSLTLLFLVSAAAISGCSSGLPGKQENGKDVLFSIDGTSYYADDILGLDAGSAYTYNFLESTVGVAALYDAVKKAVVESAMPVNQNIQNAADLAYEKWEDEVDTYAESNSISVRDARRIKLESSGYETVEELKADLLFAERSTALTTSFKNSRTEPKLENRPESDPTTMLEKYVSNAAPMVVSHVLATIGDRANEYTKANITENEAIDLATIVRRLALGKASGNSFSQVAGQLSGDTGSATKGGMLGIMDSYSAYVNEFKLGLYVYEAVQKQDNVVAQATLSTKLGLSSAVDTLLFGDEGIYKDYVIETIDVATLYSELHDKAADKGVQTDPEKDDTTLYPRNVFYNANLNTGRLQFLTLAADADTTLFPLADRSTNSNNIVVDANGNPIAVLKSTYGVHFLSLNFSSLGLSEIDAAKYFMHLSSAASGLTDTYVKNPIYTGYTTLELAQRARKTEIENRITNYIKGGYSSQVSASDAYYDYELFNYYYGLGNVTIPNAAVNEAIQTYLSLKYSTLNTDIEKAKTSEWNSYIRKIQFENEMKGGK